MRLPIGLLIVAAWSQMILGQSPARPTSSDAASTAAIRGRVVDATSGVGVAGMVVHLNAANPTRLPPGSRSATTNGDGRYEFVKLPAGTYTALSGQPGYLVTAFGEPFPRGLGTRLTLKAGQRLEHIDLRLRRPGNISGRVLNDHGDSLAGMDIVTYSFQHGEGGGRRLEELGWARAQTNDRGEYRISGLSPGLYYVLAEPRSFATEDQQRDEPSTYAPTLYPGASRFDDARLLTMTPGQSIEGINLTLPTTPTARVSGMAVDHQGRPVGHASIVASHDPGGFGSFGMFTKPDGTFTLRGLPAGDYSLRAIMVGQSVYSAPMPLTVSGRDITALQLPVARTSIIGRVTFEKGGAPPPPAGAIHIWSYRSAPLIAGNSSQSVTLGNDLTFDLPVLAGHAFVRASPLPAWRLNRVLLNGKDVTDSGVDVPFGERLEVVVEMTDRLYPISGKVAAAGVGPFLRRVLHKGGYVRDCRVIIFGQDPDTWSPGMRYLAAMRPGVDGLFHATLPAGYYFGVAMPDMENGTWNDPEFLMRARMHATKFTIDADHPKAADLKLSSLSQP